MGHWCEDCHGATWGNSPCAPEEPEPPEADEEGEEEDAQSPS
jgi:hypothetical protein